MKKKLHTCNIQFIFMIFLIIINLATLHFVSPLSQNLSDLGNLLGHRLYLILWAITTSLYLYIYTLRLLKDRQYHNKLGYVLLGIACCSMVLSVILPYNIYTFPILSKWHTRIAIGATSLYVIVFYHFIIDTMKKDYLFYEQTLIPFTFLVIFDLLLFILNGGVSTLIEISFSIGMSILLYLKK
ncbi:MAG: hypothetical protein RR537_07535 [Longicatena sp.]